MYITETTDNVRKLIEELEQKDDNTKLKFLIYIFGLLNNDQINNKNEENPNLKDNDDLEIFNFQSIGFEENFGTVSLQYLVMIYNKINKNNEIYEENGNIYGIIYNKNDKQIISNFEKLDFKEKLDIFSEIIIKYHNETYFENNFEIIIFNQDLNGFDIAALIQDFKSNI